jgi:hypothetical protein
MWTLILVIVISSGAAIGGVGATTTFLDFSDETKCRAAATAMAAADQVTLDTANTRRPPISPPAIYRIIARCVER